MYQSTLKTAIWCAALVLLCLLAGVATAATITVPDDEPTIQAAINNATAGDTIFVDSGTYNENVEVNKTLVLTGNMTGWNYPIIDGGGIGSTVNITAEDVVFEHFNVTGSSSDSIEGCDYSAGIRVVADNATIIDNDVHDNYYGISLNGSDGSWVYDNWVHDNSDHGIFLGYANNNDVTWNNASSNGQNGIMLNFNSTDNLVADNSVAYNSYMGIRLRWASYNTLEDNFIHDNYGYGDFRIQEGCWYNIVTGNLVQDAYYHGIRIEENCSYNQVTYNTILGCDRPGIMLKDDSNHNTVTDNYINDTGSGPGITVQYSRDNLIAANEIRNASSCGGGVYLYGAVQNTVRDNAIFDSYNGIYLYDAVQNTIRDNAIFDSSEYGVEIYWFSDNNQVLDNIIENAGSDGIYLTSSVSRNIISGNEVNGSYNDGIYVQDSGNNTFRDNVITNGNDDGINLYNASNNIFGGNSIENNQQNGIYLDTGSSGNSFSGNDVINNICSGVLVESSDDNYFRGNLFADSGYYGIEVYGGSIGAVFRQNYVLNNTLGGVYIWNSVSECTFYDNHFNNTANAVFETPTAAIPHLWNVTPTTGPNIVGGPAIGGNFWVTPAGDGWSETHDDTDRDGFCDEIYNVSESDPSYNWDFFPLHAPYADFTQSGRSGVAPYTVTFTDASGLAGVPADYYNWTFGDGSGAIFQTATSIQHTYTVPGIYDVTMYVTNIYGDDTVVKTDWIYVYQQSSGTSGGGGTVGGAAPGGTEGQGEMTEETIIKASDGIGKLTIPAGTQALDKDGNPVGGIGMVPLADIPREPEGLFSFAGYAWQCTPAGATFDPPITLTLTFTAEEWAALDPAAMSLQWYNPATGLWETIPAVIDPVTMTVTAQISHFSVFALFEAAEEVVEEEEGEVVIVEEVPTTGAPTTAPPTTQSPLAFAPVLALGAIPFLLRRK